MTLEKLSRDRKILRRIDFNIAQHGRYVAIVYFVIYLAVAGTGGFYRDQTALCVAFGAMLLLIAFAMLYFSLRFEQLHGAGPNRWRRHFVLCHWASKACWGIFAAYITTYYGLNTNTFLVVILTVCTGAISNVEWAPFHRANYIAQSILFLPLMVSLMLLHDINGFVVGSIVLVVYALLIRQSNILSKRHWNAEKTSYELNIQTRDLAQAVKEAHSASQVKAEFLANVTHEIRTPMNNVLGMLALLDDTELSSQQKQLQNVAVHSGEALLSLIDDVLDYSKIVSGSIGFNDAVFSLRRCMNQCLELLGPVAHSRGIEVSVIYERDIPIRIKSDEDRLAQIITNLVSSTLRTTDGSEVVMQVSLQKDANAEGTLRIDVTDNGKALDEGRQAQLFEAFSNTLATAQSVQQDGTGLGLAIAKGLVESRGGHIGIEHQRKQGSHIWFTLPVGVSTQQAQIDYTIRPLVNSHALIVDAEAGMVDALVSELEGLKISAVAIKGNDAAMQELRGALRQEHSYSLVLINCPIREQLHFGLLDQLAQAPEFREIKVVLLASLAQRTRHQHDIERYPNVEWLTKPVTRIGLANSLAKLYDLEARDSSDGSTKETRTIDTDEAQSILLVEDNKVNQMVARGMLNKLGYTVSVANNGKEAISILEDRPFDLILMDCLMPEMDGYEATAAIREKEKTTGGHIPIVAMTASVIEGEQTRCLSAGMDDYLAKPVNVDELAAKLRHWLEDKNIADKEDGVVHTGKHIMDNNAPQRRFA
ncbi:MAG: response regulator [Ketobacteraceae bacterium]|nr:response regulator [Ketobacteraceae bacterium]